MNATTLYFSYDWWRDIWLPMAGAILIPLAIAFFTWFFGANRAEKEKDFLRNKAALNYLKSICCYTIVNLLTLRKAIKIRNELCLKYSSASDEEHYFLFSTITFQDIYSQIDVEKYAEFTTIYASFVIDLLQVKRSLKDIFETLDLINMSIKELHDVNSIPSHLIAMERNFPCLLWKICFSIDKLLYVIRNTEYIQKKMNLSDIVEIYFSEEEQQQLAETKKELRDFMNKSNEAGERINDQ